MQRHLCDMQGAEATGPPQVHRCDMQACHAACVMIGAEVGQELCICVQPQARGGAARKRPQKPTGAASARRRTRHHRAPARRPAAFVAQSTACVVTKAACLPAILR